MQPRRAAVVVAAGAIAACAVLLVVVPRHTASYEMCLRTRWLKLPLLSPDAQEWEHVAKQIVTEYLATNPPMFEGDPEILVELPFDWPGPLPQGHMRYRFVQWRGLEELADDRSEVEFIMVDWGLATIASRRFSVRSEIQHRRHPNIGWAYTHDRHYRTVTCTFFVSDWDCNVAETDG